MGVRVLVWVRSQFIGNIRTRDIKSYLLIHFHFVLYQVHELPRFVLDCYHRSFWAFRIQIKISISINSRIDHRLCLQEFIKRAVLLLLQKIVDILHDFHLIILQLLQMIVLFLLALLRALQHLLHSLKFLLQCFIFNLQLILLADFGNLNPVEKFRHPVLHRFILFEHNLVETSVWNSNPAFVLVTFML